VGPRPTLSLLSVALIAAGTPVLADRSSPAIDPIRQLPGVAVIERSAATNLAGFSITVTRAGAATVRSGPTIRSVDLGQELARQLYADLDRAGRLGDLPTGHCMKSASFGTTTTIAYGGQRSPDLQCAHNAVERSLNEDAQTILQTATSGMRQGWSLPTLIAPASPK
jgi:hypothetical protein